MSRRRGTRGAAPPADRAVLEGRAIRSRILWDELGLIAVDKPSGLASTGRDLHDPDCVQWQLSAHFGKPIWAVHQLDTRTSGVNLFVRRKSLVAVWQDKLARARKTYLALCHGLPSFEHLEVDAPIGGRSTPEGWKLMVREGGKAARSRVYVRQRGAGHCLLEVEIATGRTHQVRIHLAHLGHPLVGEQRYMSPPCELAAGHFLHAAELLLGRQEEPPRLTAEPPEAFVAMARRLGLALG
jgi:23S rRNA-/tRNA-specific pseudouridylate synthase